jgi:hypothetical protein
MHSQAFCFRSQFQTGPSGPKILRTISVVLLTYCYSLGKEFPASQAQQVQTGVASQSLRESFFEYQGTSWTLVGPSGFARFGPAQRWLSPLPVFDTSPPAIGLYFDSQRTRGEFYGYWSQGVQRSHQSIDLSLTLSDGLYGSFACQSLRPFVTGFRPAFASTVNKGFQPPLRLNRFAGSRIANVATNKWDLDRPQQAQSDRPFAQRPDTVSPPKEEPPLVLGQKNLQGRNEDSASREAVSFGSGSSAERVVMSVDEARKARQDALERMNQIAQSYLDLCHSAVRTGRREQARIYLRLAAQYASGDLRDEVTRLEHELERTEK